MVLGIDVSKAKLDYCLVNDAKKTIAQGIVTNNTKGIKALLKALHQQHPQLVVAAESTGIYHQFIQAACLDLNITFRLINPIQTKQFNSTTVRGCKTDKKDAKSIAVLGSNGAGYIVKPATLGLQQAKSYMRTMNKLQKQLRTLKMMENHFNYSLNQLDASGLQSLQASTKQQVESYRAKAIKAFGTNSDVDLLQTIPGVGPITALGFLVEVGDWRRFNNASSIVAYAGLDPKIKQSGKVLVTGRLTKRGSANLRKYLFIAAMVARRFDPQLQAVYDKKRAQGKSHKAATCHIARKLVHRMYAVLKRGTPYVVLEKS